MQYHKSQTLSRTFPTLDSRTDEENPLFIRCKVPHHQRIEQMPCGHPSHLVGTEVNLNSFSIFNGDLQGFYCLFLSELKSNLES